MATSASRSRLFPARSRKSYRLEMESRTLYLLLSLMALTGVVVFYLGVVTGKALRDPNAPVALSAQLGTAVTPAGEQKPAGPLAFSEAVKGDQTVVENLREEGQDATKRTETLLNEAQKQLELREVTPTPPKVPSSTTAPATASAPKAPATSAPASAAVQTGAMPKALAPAPAPRAPVAAPPTAPQVAAPAPPAADQELYTVQVFSSQRQDSARQLMERLRAQGFAAYLNRFEAADRQVWYRVRVGRGDRNTAEQLQSRLKSEANLKNPQIQKL